MTEAREVAVVVLCWNDAPRVRALVAGLARQSVAPARVVVVDNGSGGGTPRFDAHTAFPVDVLAMPSNLGFAAGANRGIARALDQGARWVWLLNSDVSLPDRALERLLGCASTAVRCGMVGAILLEPDGRIQARGGGRVELDRGLAQHVTQEGEACDYLSGACLLLRAQMLREIGFFDERYFFYWEDVDLGCRARLADWGLLVAQDCQVVHEEAASLGRWSTERWEHLFRGMVLFVRDHSQRPGRAIAVGLLRHSVVMLRHGRLAALRGAWRGAGREWWGSSKKRMSYGQ